MALLSNVANLLLVIAGFGFIIFLHELGHFLAARWAGIRVLAFAIGFGPALVTYRKGLGWRRGSSEREYFQMTARGVGDGISPTEYRVNALFFFGGYVKMLGQEDLDPRATSSAGDSYQNCKVWKRMIVISAGVVMNIISAMVIFVGVFMAGLPDAPAKVGLVDPGSPAAKALVRGAGAGLRPGDEILLIDHEKPDSFNDIALAASMSGPNQSLELLVKRPGVAAPLHVTVTPEVSRLSGLREIGIEPPRTRTLPVAKTSDETRQFEESVSRLGFPGLKPGMSLESVNGVPATGLHDLQHAIDVSDGAPVGVSFLSPAGERFATTLTPRPELRQDVLPKPPGVPTPVVDHLLGLTPVMQVGVANPPALDQGLKDADIFARIGDVEFPSLWQGLAQIRDHPGESLPIVVLRRDEKGVSHEVKLDHVKVDSRGTIGFLAKDVGDEMTLVSMPPDKLQALTPPRSNTGPYAPAATRIIESPGTQIVSVAGTPVKNFAELRRALQAATLAQFDAWEAARGPQPDSITIDVALAQPVQGSVLGKLPVVTRPWKLSRTDVSELHSLGWVSPLPLGLFETEETLVRGKDPIDAVSKGLHKARQVMLTTYLTFARLAQGTVKVEQLKGPVGIAHLGTVVAGRGWVYLFFFLGLISINLAVINFLPLPIVDGGQFLFLLFEQIRGKPAPLAVQNAATLAGLVLLGGVFLVVTFNDVKQLLGL